MIGRKLPGMWRYVNAVHAWWRTMLRLRLPTRIITVRPSPAGGLIRRDCLSWVWHQGYTAQLEQGSVLLATIAGPFYSRRLSERASLEQWLPVAFNFGDRELPT